MVKKNVLRYEKIRKERERDYQPLFKKNFRTADYLYADDQEKVKNRASAMSAKNSEIVRSNSIGACEPVTSELPLVPGAQPKNETDTYEGVLFFRVRLSTFNISASLTEKEQVQSKSSD